MHLLKKIHYLSLFLFVAGCEHDGKKVERPQWKTTVERHSHTDQLVFSATQSSVTSKQHKTLKGLLSKASLDTPVYARLFINVPKTRKNEPLQAERIRNLSHDLKHYGIVNHRISVAYLPPHKAAILPRKEKDTITVIIDQYEMHLPQCPGWDIMGNKDASQGEDQFGCVTERNFAQMISEPKDLYEPLSMGNRDGPFNASSVDRYRNRVLEISEATSFDTQSPLGD